MATDPGAHASEYADMSNVKPGEIPGRRKPEVSRATCFVPGLAGPKPRPRGVGDGHQVNNPELATLKLGGRMRKDD